MMFLALLLQTFPFTSQNVDKLLSLDPLSLALIIGVVIVLTLLVSSYFSGRSQSSSNAQQTAVIKFFTDENSPMVASNRRVAAALEQQNKLTTELKSAFEKLGTKTDTNTAELTKQTSELGKLTSGMSEVSSTNREFSMLVTRDLSTQTESIAALTASINELNKKVDELIKDKVDCNGLREQLATFQVDLFKKLTEQTKRDSKTMAVVVPEQTINVETPREPVPPQTN